MPTRRTAKTKHVVPVHEETATVRKRDVEHGRIRIDKRVRTRTAEVRETAWRENALVERVPVNRVVSEPPKIREDGDTLVIPILEEEIVVQRRLVLREELRVRKQSMAVPFVENVTLRSEEAQVRELPPDEHEAGPSHNETETHEE